MSKVSPIRAPDVAAIPCSRDRIELEFADGSLAVRVKVAPDDVSAFWQHFPDIDLSAFLASDEGAVETVRGPIKREFADGGLAVRVIVAPADKALFQQLWPRPGMAAVLAREDPAAGRKAMQDAMADSAPLYGRFAQRLRTHVGFMGSRRVWQAVGSDEDYLAWVRTRPCAICKWTPHWEMDTLVPCHAAHVRRIEDGAGTSIKPKYSAIPLCPPGHGKSCHQLQHQQGESALGGKEALDRLRVHYVYTWLWETLKEKLGYAHWNDVPPQTLVAWASEHGALDCLPKEYLEAC